MPGYLSSVPPGNGSVLTLAITSPVTLGQQGRMSPPPLASTSAQQMTKAASAFLASLTESQRDAIVYEFTPENRTNWSNTPPFVHDRPPEPIDERAPRPSLALLLPPLAWVSWRRSARRS